MRHDGGTHPSKKKVMGEIMRLVSAELTQVTSKTGAFFCVFLGALALVLQMPVPHFTQVHINPVK